MRLWMPGTALLVTAAVLLLAGQGWAFVLLVAGVVVMLGAGLQASPRDG